MNAVYELRSAHALFPGSVLGVRRRGAEKLTFNSCDSYSFAFISFAWPSVKYAFKFAIMHVKNVSQVYNSKASWV